MNTEGTAAPSGAQPTPVAPPPAPVVAVPAASDDQNPPWLKGRLERAQKEALEALGITDPAKAKAALDAAKKAEDEAKSAAQRLGETSTALEAERARAAAYESVIKERAASEIGGLTADQQAAVRKIAPDTDPAAQLRAITALAPTWKAAAPAAPAAPAATTPAAATPAAVAPSAPPANTAPPPTAPPSAAGSPPDHKAEYARLKQSNPVAASAYMLEHADKIYPRA
ncbi:MAG TPA: hypothetical protein VL494_13655 [Steroidobacteraceae bacterium]|nr:hypothetical protein [Steroidobacteraceae bacterium]